MLKRWLSGWFHLKLMIGLLSLKDYRLRATWYLRPQFATSLHQHPSFVTQRLCVKIVFQTTTIDSFDTETMGFNRELVYQTTTIERAATRWKHCMANVSEQPQRRFGSEKNWRKQNHCKLKYSLSWWNNLKHLRHLRIEKVIIRCLEAEDRNWSLCVTTQL